MMAHVACRVIILLASRDDYLRALRSFLRELIRQVKGDFNFVLFNQALMQAREDALFTRLEPQHKVVCCCHVSCFLSFSALFMIKIWDI